MIVEVFQYVIEQLGGMEMGCEFFKLHTDIEAKLMEFAKQGFKFHDETSQSIAARFYHYYIQPLIDQDREVAKLQNSRWS